MTAAVASMESSVYALNNGGDGVEVNRLNSQHDYFKSAAGDKLLPEHVMKHVQSLPSPAIADVGTGTGVWLEDLAKHLPRTAQLDGFDFDVSKFPAKSDLPSNINLAFANALEPFPEKLKGTYDVVHVRLLVFALKADQWDIVAAHLRSLLKPGGWLLWEELGYPNSTCIPMSEFWNEWVTVDSTFAASVGRDVKAPIRLKQQVEGAGLVNCEKEIYSTFDVEEKLSRSDVIIRAAEQSMTGIVARGGSLTVQTVDDIKRVTDGMLADRDKGHEIGISYWWVWGQNPQ